MNKKMLQIRKIMINSAIGCTIWEDLKNFIEYVDLTPIRVLEEVGHWLYLVDADGWESHLDNPQQIKSLKLLYKKIKKFI